VHERMGEASAVQLRTSVAQRRAFISEVISAQCKSRACMRAALPQPDCLVGTELRMLEAHAWVSGGLSSVPAWVYPGSTAQPHGGQAHIYTFIFEVIFLHVVGDHLSGGIHTGMLPEGECEYGVPTT
jgi:hypothetical protein